VNEFIAKLIILITLLSLLTACSSPAAPGADTVFRGGAVYTVDDDRSWAEAVAISDGEIVFVGSDEDVVALIGADTEVIEIDGKMLMPGFHDAHAHVRHGGSSLLGCSLHAYEDVAAIRSRLAECVSSGDYGPDDWVTGGGWQLAAFPDGAPHAALLDEIFGGRPAFFNDAFGHNAWVSTRALELAGIDATTPDPPQGVIVRNPETGEPSGTLRDGAMALVEDILPAEDEADRYASLVAGLQEANSFGITAYIDPGVMQSSLGLYQAAASRDELTARVVASLSPLDEQANKFGPELFDLLAVRDRYRSDYLDVDSVKVYIDGVIETRTSFMLEPYLDGSNFPPFYEQEELNNLYERLDGMGLQIHTHAIGDGAIRSALDAYEHALFANGPNDNRHQMVHLQLIDAPVRSVKNSGGLIVGGSDWDVSSLNPLDAIETAIRRQDPSEENGRVLGENEEIDLAAALDMYTRNSAHIMRLEQKTGSIEVGKRADLIVLDRNLFDIPVTEINETRVLLTLMDGRTVYSAEAER
jgi:predicted amidohydrolase YtcJ